MATTIYLADQELEEQLGMFHYLTDTEARELMEMCEEVKPHDTGEAFRRRRRELGMHKPTPVYEELSGRVIERVIMPLPAWGFRERRQGCWVNARVRIEITRYSIWVNGTRYTDAEQALLMIAQLTFPQ